MFEQTFEIGEIHRVRISPATDLTGGTFPPLDSVSLGRIVGPGPGVGKHLTRADTVACRLPPAAPAFRPHRRETARVSGEHYAPIEVRLDGDRPAEFATEDKVYVVRDVLAQWIESAPWWRSPTTTGIPADLGERELWRVVASSADGESDVFDLSFDRGRSAWSLVVEPKRGE